MFKQNTFLQNLTLIKVFLPLLIGMGSLALAGSIFHPTYFFTLAGVLSSSLPFAILLCLAYTYYQGLIKWFQPHWYKAFWQHGKYLLMAGSIVFFISLLGVEAPQIPTLPKIIYYLAFALFTGLFEELMCRGLFQNLLLRYGSKHNLSPLKSIILASTIFGVLHFFNLFTNPQYLLGTISQVVYASALGFVLGSIYYQVKSLFVVALLHGTFNALGSLQQLLNLDLIKDAGDITLFSLLLQWIILLPLVIPAYKSYKKYTKEHSIS